MADTPRWTEYLPVADLQPATRNAKAHDREALQASVDLGGYIEPVVLDERTGQLLAGHGRVDDLTEREAAGAPAPDGVVVGDDGRWQWLVVRGVRSRDDTHAEAIGIALNRVGERGGWHRDVLAESLDAMRAADLLDSVGFTADYLDDLLADLAGPPNLDDLAAGTDPSSPSDFWPVLRFKVAPELRSRYLALVADVPGGDADQFLHLVEQAEHARASR